MKISDKMGLILAMWLYLVSVVIAAVQSWLAGGIQFLLGSLIVICVLLRLSASHFRAPEEKRKCSNSMQILIALAWMSLQLIFFIRQTDPEPGVIRVTHIAFVVLVAGFVTLLLQDLRRRKLKPQG